MELLGKLEQSPRAAEAGRNNKRASNLLAATIVLPRQEYKLIAEGSRHTVT